MVFLVHRLAQEGRLKRGRGAVAERRVVVTGIGLVTPLGTGVRKNWKALLAGASGAGEVTRFDASRLPVRIAAEVKDYHPETFLDRKDIRTMSASVRFAIGAATEAVEDAGLPIPLNGEAERAGVIVGVGMGLHPAVEVMFNGGAKNFSNSLRRYFVPTIMGNMAASQVAIRLNFRGPNACTCTACASGTHAIGEAMKLIQRGAADTMVAGGTESCLFEFAMGGFCAMRALSHRNDEPARASRPFDALRDGFVLGEGSGLLVLEAMETAKARGAKIYAELRGYGLNSNAFHITLPDPSGEGPARCMQLALEDAGVSAGEVDYINAHGSSTGPNDRSETAAIKRTFGPYAYRLAVSSTKSMTGHLLGASGAVEAAFSALSIHHQMVPPTINYEEFDPDCDLDYVPNAPRKMKVRNALTNSFAFGGANACLLLSKYNG